MAELAASNTGRERVIADRDRIILELVRKVVVALGHGTNENADAFFRAEILDVVPYSDHRCIEGNSDLSAVRWQMVCDGILNDLQKLLLRCSRPDRQLM